MTRERQTRESAAKRVLVLERELMRQIAEVKRLRTILKTVQKALATIAASLEE